MNKTSQLPREFNNIGIKPTLNENMDETYKNRREHLKKWMKYLKCYMDYIQSII